MAEAVWRSGLTQDGYTNRNPYYADVEHMAEPISYTIPMMLMIDYENPLWLHRAYENAIHFGMDWTVLNNQSHRFFRGHYFNAYDFEDRPGRETENPENGRAIKNTIITAWKDQSPTLKQWLGEWGEGMAYHANQTSSDVSSPYYKKPVGFIPGEIEPYSGTAGFYTGDWYRAFYKEVGHNSYSWLKGFNGVRQQIDAFLSIGILNNNSFILEMVEKMFEYLLINQSVNNVPANKPDLDGNEQLQFNGSGDVLWKSAAEMRMPNTALIWQKSTRNTELNTLFQKWGEKMIMGMRSQLGGEYFPGNISTDDFNRELGIFEGDDPKAIGPAGYMGWWYGDRQNKTLATLSLESIAESVRQMWNQSSRPIGYNAIQKRDDRQWIGYTDHTAQQLEPNGEMLNWFTTGGIGSCEARYPYLPVTYEYEEAQYNVTPLVMEENSTHIDILFYNFNNNSTPADLRFWQLKNGSYIIEAGIDANGDDVIDTVDYSHSFKVNERRTLEKIILPARSTYMVKIKPISSTDPLPLQPFSEPIYIQYLYGTQRVSINNRKYDSADSAFEVRTWGFLNEAKDEIYFFYKVKNEGSYSQISIDTDTLEISKAEYIHNEGVKGTTEIDDLSKLKKIRVDSQLRCIKFTLKDIPNPDIHEYSIYVERSFANSVYLLPLILTLGLIGLIYLVSRIKRNRG